MAFNMLLSSLSRKHKGKAMIENSEAYIIIDIQTGSTVYETTYSKRNVARRKAERMNLKYGAHRYSAKVA